MHRSGRFKRFALLLRRTEVRALLAGSVLILLLLGGCGLIYYARVVQPARDRATATVGAATATASGQAGATATTQATTPQVIYARATSGQPLLNDPLSSGVTSYWRETRDQGGSCTFSGGRYLVRTTLAGRAYYCYAWPAFSDFAFAVRVTILAGDAAGIVFRASPTASTFFLFSIDQTGSYHLDLYLDQNAADAQRLSGGNSPALNTGLDQENLLTVIAHGPLLYLFANTQYLATVRNSTLSSGRLGLVALGAEQHTDVVFSDARGWSF
jgi:hypothetical protein